MRKGGKDEDPLGGINIEDVFSAMQTLASRELFEAAPFVAGWHPMVESLDTVELRFKVEHGIPETTQQVNGSIARNIDSAIQDQVNQKRSGRKVGDEVRRMVEESLRHLKSQVSGGGEQSGGGHLFRATCQTMVKKLISLVRLKPEDRARVDYLRPLVRHAFHSGTSIATLNYDTAVEIAAQAEGIRVDSCIGMGASSEEEAENCVTLLKPHGSINWCSANAFYVRDVLPETHISTADEEEMRKPSYVPAVIFGLRNKLTAEGPFLTLFSRFRDELKRADELVIIGYSFRDHHVNESIASWFNRNPARTIILVTPDKGWAKQSEFAGKLACLADTGSRLRVLPETAKCAIPKLFPIAAT